MPSVYRCPSAARRGAGDDALLCLHRQTTLFNPGMDVTRPGVKDGLSNTIAVVETRAAIPWTKPEDLPFDPDRPAPPPLYGAGSAHPGGFNSLFADGSVRFLANAIKVETLPRPDHPQRR